MKTKTLFSHTVFAAAVCLFSPAPESAARTQVTVSVNPSVNTFHTAYAAPETEQASRIASATPAENYARGIGYARTGQHPAALPYFRAAAEAGHAPAQYAYGYCYAHGFGAAQNDTIADFWYQKAAAQNSPEIFESFRKAAAAGHALERYFLGYCYFNGYGVARDYTLASKCFAAAAAQNHQKAKQALDYIKEKKILPPPPPPPRAPPAPPAPPAKKQALQFGDFTAAAPEFSINEVPRPAPGEILHTAELAFKNGAAGRLSFILSADKKNLRAISLFIHKLPEDFSFDEMKSFDKTGKPVNIGESNDYSLFDDMVKIKNLVFSGGAVTADIGVVFLDVHSGKKQDIGETPVSFSSYFVGKAGADAPALIFVHPKTASKTSASPAAETAAALTTINIRLIHESQPRAQKEVRLLWYNPDAKKWEETVQNTDKDGLATFQIPRTASGASRSFFAAFSQKEAGIRTKLADAGKILLYRAPAGTPVLELQMTGEEGGGISKTKGSVQLWGKE